MSNWTREQRRRHAEEVRTGTEPEDIRAIFLTAKQKAKRKRKAAQVTARLLGKKIR